MEDPTPFVREVVSLTFSAWQALCYFFSSYFEEGLEPDLHTIYKVNTAADDVADFILTSGSSFDTSIMADMLRDIIENDFGMYIDDGSEFAVTATIYKCLNGNEAELAALRQRFSARLLPGVRPQDWQARDNGTLNGEKGEYEYYSESENEDNGPDEDGWVTVGKGGKF